MRKFLDGAIVVAAAGFIAILALSAVYDHTIIWLHVFQAAMYLAVIALVSRRNRLGYFLAVSIAGLWNYTAIFVDRFFANGMRALAHLTATGQLTHPDQMIAVGAVVFHFVMIAAALTRIVQTSRKAGSDLLTLLVVFAVSTGYFAADIALCQPRYLQLFPRLIHPHSPF